MPKNGGSIQSRLALPVLLMTMVLVGGCGGEDEAGGGSGGGGGGGAGNSPAAGETLRPADVLTCFEAGTEVREDQGQFANPRRFAVATRQRGYLDVDFADVYFFDDVEARRTQTAREVAAFKKALQDPKKRKLYEDAKELGVGGDPRSRQEAYGNVLVDYAGSEDTRDKGLAASCLSEAGEREDLSAQADR